MKNILKFCVFILFAVSLLQACKKDDKQIFFEGGTAPELKQLSAKPDSVLLRINREKEFVNLAWTNPNYRFTTGTSSQDVTYILQVDTTGSNFTNPKMFEKEIPKDLGVSVTVSDINTYLTKMELSVDVPHDIELRIVSSLSGSVKLNSNVLKFEQIVMYEDFAIPPPANGELFVVGDGTTTGWNNNPSAPHYATKISKGLFVDTLSLEAGKYYKYLTIASQWQPQYGLKPGSGGASGGDIGFNNQTPQFPSDPDAIPTPGTGDYIVTLNFTTGKFTVVPK